MSGEGTYKFANGRIYKGQWKDGHMSGEGKMQFPCGSEYEGSYEKDIKSGEGTFRWPDGRIYKGQWKDGKQHGKGYTIDLKRKTSSLGKALSDGLMEGSTRANGKMASNM